MMLTKDNFEKLDRWQIDTALATWRAMSNSMYTTRKRDRADDSFDARDVACLVDLSFMHYRCFVLLQRLSYIYS